MAFHPFPGKLPLRLYLVLLGIEYLDILGIVKGERLVTFHKIFRAFSAMLPIRRLFRTTHKKTGAEGWMCCIIGASIRELGFRKRKGGMFP